MRGAPTAQKKVDRTLKILGARKTVSKLLKASDYSFTNRDKVDVEKCIKLGVRMARKAAHLKKSIFYVYAAWEWFIFLENNEAEVIKRLEEM